MPEPKPNKSELAALNWSAPPVSHDIEENLNQDIPRDDKTPSVLEQAKADGWKCEYYHFGKAEDPGVDYFNPGIIRRPDGLWLLTRASGLHPQGFMYGQNAIIAFKLDDTGKQPCYGKVLNWDEAKTVVNQHFEDPRGFYHPALGQTLIGCCTFTWDAPGSWSGPHQAFGAFDEDWNCKKMDYPVIGGNPGTMEKIKAHKDYEKNWLWFLLEDGHLALLYKANPWTVFVFGNRWSEKEEIKKLGVTWPYGEIRGGTTPIQVGDMFFTFHHSSLPWKGRYRRYYAGCLAFDAKPPFTPRLITEKPILIGSQQDTWAQRKPLVVFPCGAVYKNETWLVTLGVNDMVSAWLELPHKDLFSRMKPVEQVADPIFKDYGLPIQKEILSGGSIPIDADDYIKNNLSGGVDRHAGVLNSSLPRLLTDSSTVRHSEASNVDALPAQKPSKKKRKPFSPEALENLRAAAAKARAARMAKREMVESFIKDYGKEAARETFGKTNSEPPKRRRKRRRKPKDLKERRLQAVQEFEAKNSVAT